MITRSDSVVRIALRSVALGALLTACSADPPGGAGNKAPTWEIDPEASSARLRTEVDGEEILCSLPWLPAQLIVGDRPEVSAVLRFDVSRLSCQPSWATEFLAGPLLLDAANEPHAVLSFDSAEKRASTVAATIELCGSRRTVPLAASVRTVDAHTIEINGEVEVKREWFGMSFESYRAPDGEEIALDPFLGLRFTAIARTETVARNAQTGAGSAIGQERGPRAEIGTRSISRLPHPSRFARGTSCRELGPRARRPSRCPRRQAAKAPSRQKPTHFRKYAHLTIAAGL